MAPGVRAEMPFELDHVFICTSVEAPEAGMLAESGLTEGPGNTHPGQGTANRRFFFQNAMLELLWVENEAESKSALTRPTRLWERWIGRGQGSCPFGVCLRPATGSPIPPFPAWQYKPKYLPEPLHIDVATNSDILTEPMLFSLPFAKRRDADATAETESSIHPIGFRKITRLEIITPYGSDSSPELKAMVQGRFIHLGSGAEYAMKIGFDEERMLRMEDFRPHLPLVFQW